MFSEELGRIEIENIIYIRSHLSNREKMFSTLSSIFRLNGESPLRFGQILANKMDVSVLNKVCA